MKGKQKPKDRLKGFYMLDGLVSEILETAELVASEAAPNRRGELLEQIVEIKSLQCSGDADKLGAACFHLGVTVGAVVSFRGQQHSSAERWAEAVRIERTLYEKNGVWPTARRVWQAMNRDKRWPLIAETSFATEFSKHRKRPRDRR